MSLQEGKVFERSVDSIEKIYAVVIALAISQAVQSLLKDPSGGVDISLEKLSSGLPAFLAFLVTLVPFWHGMNRHLDRCYLEKTSGVVQGALLLDFSVFFLEASFLFAAAWSLRSGIESFYYLGLLLVVDMVWGGISHQIHFPGKKSHAVKWSRINAAALVAAILIVTLPFQPKTWVLLLVAVLRTFTDYGCCWDFYFPSSVSEVGGQDQTPTPSLSR
jgi:hypothetical protein